MTCVDKFTSDEWYDLLHLVEVEHAMCLKEPDQEHWLNIHLKLKSLRDVDARKVTQNIVKKSIKGNSL